MGLFGRNRKIKNENKLPEEHLKWNKMWELWVSGDIETPYAELMEYLSGVNNGGHHCHLDNINCNADLKEYVDAITSVLPEPLKSNLLLAYNTYSKNADKLSDEDIKILEYCDSIYYNNEKLINNILNDRASRIEL